MRKSHFLAASSLLAIAASSSAAWAQDATTNSEGVEQVIVSASRISIAGYQAPTPVTVVDSAQLERDARTDIGDVIRELPAFGGSTSPNNSVQSSLIVTGDAGLNEVSLRNLGVLRTLVLVDGQRIVASNIADGAVDLNTIPTSLVQRVDVVTGGASAAWGSDAVAGVVNLILDKNFSGFKANVEGGDNSDFQHESYKFEASFGTAFDGDRGHLILSGSYLDSPQSFFANQANWFNGTKLVNNPTYTATNGQPALIHANNVGLAQATQGGLIVSNPAGTTPGSANILANTQFVGPAGAPAPFIPGNVSSIFSNGGNAETTISNLNMLAIPLRSQTAFALASYKLTPDIQASIQLNYGGSRTENNSYAKVNYGNITINAGNPFIPASIAATMAANGITSFNLGSTNLNNFGTNGNTLVDNSMSSQAQSLGVPVTSVDRQLLRAVFSLDGSLGNDWSWSAYYQHGESRVFQTLLNNVQTANYNNAVNAVTVTAANRGASGLPIGSIACASTLANPTNGCMPLDVFGDGVASAPAIKYIDGAARNGGDNEITILDQDVASGSMTGKLPWGLPAGAVAVSFGAEYRKEAGREIASPLAAAHSFSVGNFTSFVGEYNVMEGYVEVDAPILKDDFVQSLDFNAAGRMTSYSTSGLVETWKLGLTSQVNDDLRLRTTWSLDIRAPDLSELFSGGVPILGSAVDPHTGQNVQIYELSAGNPNLKPEQATTISGGVVLTPHWVEGLSVSADWYSIDISKAIVTISSSTILANCNAGQALYCGQLVFGGPGGALSQINSGPLNADQQTVSGVDFNADYITDFLAGKLLLHLVGNYTDEQTQTDQGIKYDYAGSLSYDSPFVGVPKFKATLAATYSQDAWSATAQTRVIGSAHLVNGWTPLNVDNNSVPQVAYFDLRGSYRVNDNIQIYAAADNVFDTPPPDVPGSAASVTDFETSARDDIYDAFGRVFRIGLRLNY
jgi:outer membrane receptor protein involved in Fe transport